MQVVTDPFAVAVAHIPPRKHIASVRSKLILELLRRCRALKGDPTLLTVLLLRLRGCVPDKLERSFRWTTDRNARALEAFKVVRNDVLFMT